MQSEDVSERRVDHVHRSQADRTDQDPGQERRGEKHHRRGQPEPSARWTHQRMRLSVFATAWTRLTTRGPQRDATESSITTTERVRTAATPLHPGRLATAAADCPQQRPSARTIRPGFAERMYSAESLG